MSGSAWQVRHPNGRVIRWIEAPFPRGALSLAVFLHEVGHHVIGFERYKQRCEEEYHVWCWALDEMRRLGVKPNARVLDRFRRSMQFAVSKAMRRGLKQVPETLKEFEPKAA
ncbi:MAG TPA: hypothetical protein VG326_10705 [Tepidisphaeraceae bacterium]|jgi:hypothetical protein|nr:hypothetical protein [Tepidisphaeraceae bacterium]